MKITCPVCSSSYMVPDSALGATGRKVKCASCGHVWHQGAPQDPSEAPVTDIHEDIRATKPSANLPAVTKPAFSVARVITLLVLFISGYFAGNFSSFSKGWGYYEVDGLALQDMEAEVRREGNKLVAYISGTMINESENDIVLPDKVFFKLWSGQRRVMAETDYALPEETTLAPGESIPLSPKIGNISGNARELVLDVGNSVERSFRE